MKCLLSTLGSVRFTFWPACTNSGSIYTPPDKFETTSLFLRLGLLSTLICHEHGASKTLCKPVEFVLKKIS